MPYKAIFEIGPISHYIGASRKARDLWGASFLFSYLMGICAKAVLEIELPSYMNDWNKISNVITRPSLINDQLFIGIPSDSFNNVEAGTIPDRLYCRINNEDTLKHVKVEFAKIIWDLYKDARDQIKNYYHQSKGSNNFEDNDPQEKIAEQQLKQYFRLFYVSASDNTDIEILEQAIFSRSRIFEYEKTQDDVNQASSKYERCLLCGDRRRVITIKNIRMGKRRPDEPLCAVCTVKRGLINKIKGATPFPSTTDIAAAVTKQVIEEKFEAIKPELIKFLKAQDGRYELKNDLIDEWGAEKYKIFKKLISLSDSDLQSKTYPAFQHYIEYQIYSMDFYEAKMLRGKLRKIVQEELRTQRNGNGHIIREKMLWLNRAFYAIVAMDADGIGKILQRAYKNNDLILGRDISMALSGFANNVYNLINNNSGRLIYAGGEDLLFMAHPASLLKLIEEIAQNFQTCFPPDLRTRMDNLVGQPVNLTISGGACICYHKYPLKLAIRSAHYLLDNVAKQRPGKNCLAIQLYKGSGEKAEVTLPILPIPGRINFTISKYINLIEKIMKKDQNIEIPRSFVFKLIEEFDVMSTVITTRHDLINYVSFILQKTRSDKRVDIEELSELIQNSVTCTPGGIDYLQLIEHLYFIRFLTESEL